MSTQSDSTPASKVASFFESFIYGGRWLLAPMYVGLVVAMALYSYRFCVELVYLCAEFSGLTESTLMLGVLNLLDTVMTGNLLVFVLIGSYSIFVRKLHVPDHDQPSWLKTISSGQLKTKMSTSVIGISSIHLLKTFIDAASIPSELIVKQASLHVVFLVSAIFLAYIDRLTHPTGHALSTPSNPTH